MSRTIGDDVGKLPILSVKKREGGRISIIDETGREIASVRPRKDYDAEAVARRLVASFNLCNHNQPPRGLT